MNTLKKYKFLLYIECCVNTGVNTEKKVDIGSAEDAQIMSMKHAHKAKNSWGSGGYMAEPWYRNVLAF